MCLGQRAAWGGVERDVPRPVKQRKTARVHDGHCPADRDGGARAHAGAGIRCVQLISCVNRERKRRGCGAAIRRAPPPVGDDRSRGNGHRGTITKKKNAAAARRRRTLWPRCRKGERRGRSLQYGEGRAESTSRPTAALEARARAIAPGGGDHVPDAPVRPLADVPCGQSLGFGECDEALHRIVPNAAQMASLGQRLARGCRAEG